MLLIDAPDWPSFRESGSFVPQRRSVNEGKLYAQPGDRYQPLKDFVGESWTLRRVGSLVHQEDR